VSVRAERRVECGREAKLDFELLVKLVSVVVFGGSYTGRGMTLGLYNDIMYTYRNEMIFHVYIGVSQTLLLRVLLPRHLQTSNLDGAAPLDLRPSGSSLLLLKVLLHLPIIRMQSTFRFRFPLPSPRSLSCV
jgi:hypothetical protein